MIRHIDIAVQKILEMKKKPAKFKRIIKRRNYDRLGVVLRR